MKTTFFNLGFHCYKLFPITSLQIIKEKLFELTAFQIRISDIFTRQGVNYDQF